jgi:hypothetical protein
MTNYRDDEKIIPGYFQGFTRFGFLEYEKVVFEYLLSVLMYKYVRLYE